MKKILVPSDFSDLAAHGLELAKQVAAKIDAEIHVLHVLPVKEDVLIDPTGNLLPNNTVDVAFLEKQLKDSTEKMHQWLTEHGVPQAATRIRFGPTIEDIILRYSKNHGIDLVVMGTHLMTGIKEALKLAHAEKVVYHSDIPVITLKSAPPKEGFRKVVFASDFSSGTREEMEMIVPFLHAFGGEELHLVKVNTPAKFSPTRVLLKEMQDFIENNKLVNAKPRIYCDRNVEEGIEHYMEDKQMDLLVIGTHGRKKGLGNIFHESLVKGMVNHLDLPIMTFRMK